MIYIYMINKNKSKSEEEIIIKLFIDNLWVITKINHGLCRIPHYLKASQGEAMKDKMLRWLHDNLPERKYKSSPIEYSAGFSWRSGDYDSRYYWLKSKLEMIKNL